MEKKTIGKFIAALRKANGMTQKELGEKLFVSDKTVSRWECDECTPDLSLIPLIAEIFGITADELLRGERNNPDREAIVSKEAESKQKAKSDKRFKLMLDRRTRKYQNLTLISVGITILGFIVAVIANLGFSEGLIAFCLVSAFCVASEICQICFAINVRIVTDEDDTAYLDRIQTANTSVVKTAVVISFVNILLFAFCLPLVVLYALTFEAWLDYGLLFAVIALGVCYILYTLLVRKVLCDKNLIILTEKQANGIKKNNKLLIKTILIATAIAVLSGGGIVVWDSIGWHVSTKTLVFDNCADFKAFMEGEYDTWYRERYSSYVDENGNVVIVDENGNGVVHVPLAPDYEVLYPDDGKNHEDYYPNKVYQEIKNLRCEVICEYYYNPDLYEDIRFNEYADDKMPVTVITKQAYYNAVDTFQTVYSIFCVFLVIDLVGAPVFYLIKVKRNKKSI